MSTFHYPLHMKLVYGGRTFAELSSLAFGSALPTHLENQARKEALQIVTPYIPSLDESSLVVYFHQHLTDPVHIGLLWQSPSGGDHDLFGLINWVRDSDQGKVEGSDIDEISLSSLISPLNLSLLAKTKGKFGRDGNAHPPLVHLPVSEPSAAGSSTTPPPSHDGNNSANRFSPSQTSSPLLPTQYYTPRQNFSSPPGPQLWTDAHAFPLPTVPSDDIFRDDKELPSQVKIEELQAVIEGKEQHLLDKDAEIGRLRAQIVAQSEQLAVKGEELARAFEKLTLTATERDSYRKQVIAGRSEMRRSTAQATKAQATSARQLNRITRLQAQISRRTTSLQLAQGERNALIRELAEKEGIFRRREEELKALQAASSVSNSSRKRKRGATGTGDCSDDDEPPRKRTSVRGFVEGMLDTIKPRRPSRRR